MTQQQIQDLFQQRYNQSSWKKFLAEVFVNSQLFTTPEILTNISEGVALKAVRLGYILLNEDGVDRHIACYDVTLAPGIILERNRVGLRNLLRKYWKDIDAAFIVYHRPENDNWRFSYVSELTGFDAEGELIKVKTEPKRYTYILGEGESCRTAAERFEIIARKGNEAILDDVKDAFSVEKLSKSFFNEYKVHYENYCEFMVAKPFIRQTIFNGDEKAIRDFVKKMLGRIVFLYFIQKKGWMGVQENGKWGQGNIDFLWDIFNRCEHKDLFYSEYLYKIFFDTLNTQRTDDIIEVIPGERIRIPYLNGGLFEEDNKLYRKLNFPAEMFDDLFEFFKQYNFTIYEDDPNDHIVAVDPEMLGHIFENLLEDNKDKGAYYTPKEIVHYMCQESLIEYLCTSLEIEDEEKEKEALTVLIKKKEIDDILEPELENVNLALDKVKICDPAIGSGAFPMGLLKEIFSIKQLLYTDEHGNTEGFDASAVKLNIIQNSIYGVDIEKGAVDIARLRFWLSLVVDDEVPKPLPNLDYKIVVGNSLVSKLGDDIIDIDWSLNETEQGLFGSELAIQKTELLNKIFNEQKRFFNPKSDKKKLAVEIRNLKIDLLINQLELMVKTKGLEKTYSVTGRELKKQTQLLLETQGWKNQIQKLKQLKFNPDEPLHFFDWKLDFPEVMNEKLAERGGFDIVIGNPPYVEAKKLREVSIHLKNYSVYAGTADLSSYFFERGIELCKESGHLCFINTNKFFNTGYGKPLRSYLLQNEIKRVINFEQVEVFENILVSSVIIGIRKIFSNYNAFGYKKFYKLKNTEFVNKFVSEVQYPEKYNQNDLTNDEWSFADTTNLILKAKIESKAKSLINFHGVEIYRGVTTGYNPAFIISDERKNELVNKDGKSRSLIKSLLQGRNIRKWLYNDSDDNLIFTKQGTNIENFPSIKEHLFVHFEDLKPRNHGETGGRKPGSYKWFEIQDNTAYYPEFEKPEKIVWGLTADKWAFAYDDKQHYLPSNGYILTSEKIPIKYLLGLLNSNLLRYYFGFIGVMTAGGAYTLKHATIQQLPIILVENPQIIIDKVNQILSFKSNGEDIKTLEQKLNLMVYKLYELTYDECKIVDPEIEKLISREDYDRMGIEELGEYEIESKY